MQTSTSFKESFKTAALSYSVLVGIIAMLVGYYYFIFDAVGQTQPFLEKAFTPLAATIFIPFIVAGFFCTMPLIMPLMFAFGIMKKEPYALELAILLGVVLLLILIFIKRPFAWYVMLLSVSIFAFIPLLIAMGNPFILTDTGNINSAAGAYGVAFFPFYWGGRDFFVMRIKPKFIQYWKPKPKSDTSHTPATGNTLDAHLTDGNPDD
jgi:cytochrome bd-type quinol oxidase subunit 2